MQSATNNVLNNCVPAPKMKLRIRLETVDQEAFRKRHRTFVADAMMLRAQYVYRQAW